MNAQSPTRRVSRIAVIGAALAIMMLAFAAAAQAGEPVTKKVTICHATSAGEVNPFNAITVDEGASYEPHLNSSGSPLNGHEQDFLLDFEGDDEDCEAAGPTPTPTPTPEEPTPTPTPEGSQAGGTGTPAPSVPDTATSLTGLAGPLATVVFGLVLLGSLGALAYANVSAVRRRS